MMRKKLQQKLIEAKHHLESTETSIRAVMTLLGEIDCLKLELKKHETEQG